MHSLEGCNICLFVLIVFVMQYYILSDLLNTRVNLGRSGKIISNKHSSHWWKTEMLTMFLIMETFSWISHLTHRHNIILDMWHDQGKWVTCRKISISIFLHHFLRSSKFFILMQTPLQVDVWLQSYEEFDIVKTLWNKGIWTLFLPISQKQQ